MRMGITLESLTILRGILMKRVTRSLEPVGHFILMKVCTLTLYPYWGMYRLSILMKVCALASDVWPQKHSAIEKCINWQKYWFVGYWLAADIEESWYVQYDGGLCFQLEMKDRWLWVREKKCLSLNKTKAMGGRGFANMTIRRDLFPPLTSSVISMIRTRSNDKTGERPARPLDLCNVVQGLSCSSHPTSSAVWSDGDFSATLCWEGG